MAVERTHAYRADEQLATVFREYMKGRADLRARARAWEAAHPDDLRLAMFRRQYWLGITGFEVPWTPRQGYATPNGLRKSDGKYASPYKDSRGDPWREKLAEVGKPLAVDLMPALRRLDINPETWGEGYVSWAGWSDFDADGVFMISDSEHGPNEHLIPVRMSEYWAVKESHEAAPCPDCALGACTVDHEAVAS